MQSLAINKHTVFSSMHLGVVFLIILILFLPQQGHCKKLRYINPQTPTFQALEDYLKTANPEKRKIVMSAKGSAEILASRIYNSFRQVVVPGFPDDYPNIKELAWNELEKNPELTVMLLCPVIKDNKGASWVHEGFDSDEIISLYIVLCSNFSRAEVSKLAYRKLIEMSKMDSTSFAAREARKILQELQKDNLKIVTERYRKFGMLNDLRWLYNNYLKYKRYDSLSLAEIKALFGNHYQENRKDVLGLKLIFSGNESESKCKGEQTDQKVEDEQHLIIYFDSDNKIVYRCEWEEDGKIVGDPIVWEGV